VAGIVGICSIGHRINGATLPACFEAYFARVTGYCPAEYSTKSVSCIMVPQPISFTPPEITLELHALGDRRDSKEQLS
jgi:hypothetical protein